MSDVATTETLTTTIPAVPVAPPPGSTPPAGSVAPASSQAAADAAAAAAAKVTTPAIPPAEVAYALALPKDAVIEAHAVERLTSFAKEHKLAPETAQKALDLADAEVKADRAAAMTQFAQMPQIWEEEIKADPEFGGGKYLMTVEEVKRSSDRFSTKEERDMLDTSGWKNHPILVKWFARVGRAMANDTMVNGNSNGTPAPISAAERLYGGTKAPQ